MKVYPRVCGGTWYSFCLLLRQDGLSPRVRGNPAVVWFVYYCHGSIPACAGEPIREGKFREYWRVYPRVCGGTEWAYCWLVHGVGSIPACAGEPYEIRGVGVSKTVYPRVCGGTHHHDDWYDIGEGLSPRVRGNLTRSSAWALTCGSIPACAGEPLCLLYRCDPIGSIPACAGEP